MADIPPIITPIDTDLWCHNNLTSICFYSDPDKVMYFYLTALEHEKETQSAIIATIPDLFDIENCPVKYLPYLANMVGIQLSVDDLEDTWRAQIRSAVQWYKEKGKMSSFNFVLYTMGMNAEIFPLWIAEDGTVDQYPHDASWKPHARIDIKIASYTEWRRYLPEKLQYVFSRIEEVRPIHVLIRQIILVWDFFDNFPWEPTDFIEGTVNAFPTDEWVSTYYACCGIWHFAVPQPNIYHDGGHFTWLTPAKEFLASPPLTPVTGDRYVVLPGATGLWAGHGNAVAEWNGASWVFTEPDFTQDYAIWVFHGIPPDEEAKDPGEWTAYYLYLHPDPSFTFEWIAKWHLYECRKTPGPYFRECEGDLEYNFADSLQGSEVIYYPLPDPVEYCHLHAGSIPNRDTLEYFHNCNEWMDDLEIEIIAAPTQFWDTGVWDDGRFWDA